MYISQLDIHFMFETKFGEGEREPWREQRQAEARWQYPVSHILIGHRSSDRATSPLFEAVTVICNGAYTLTNLTANSRHESHRMTALSFLVAAALVPCSAALRLVPLPNVRMPATAIASRALVCCQLGDDAPEPAAAQEADDQKMELIERAGDPFRAVRVVLYVTFGIAGTAGVVTSLLQMGDDPANAMGNLAVNAGVLAAGVAIFFFDKFATDKLREKLETDVRIMRSDRTVPTRAHTRAYAHAHMAVTPVTLRDVLSSLEHR